MLSPIKIVDIELGKPVNDLINLYGYFGVQCLVSLHGTAIGYVNVPITNNSVSANTICAEIIEKLHLNIIKCLLVNGLCSSHTLSSVSMKHLLNVPSPIFTHFEKKMPIITVAVCTRDRTSDLVLCLNSFRRLTYPHIDFLVVDNAPATNATRQLLQDHYPEMRYVVEQNPGLDWARNRAILEARGEIIAFTDDDVIVDPNWIHAFALLFLEDPLVMAATGLVAPYELETEAQLLFEEHGGFGRGFRRIWNRHETSILRWGLIGTGQYGTGANMAFRVSIFKEIGFFDTALDVGTVTNGGGDLEMYFRILKEGHTLVYEPSAIVKHRHRRDYASLKYQLANNGKGLVAYFTRSVKAYPDQLYAFFRIWLWFMLKWNLKHLIQTFFLPKNFPRDLILAEFKGSFTTFNFYKMARKRADELLKNSGFNSENEYYKVVPVEKKASSTVRKPGMGVRFIDLSEEYEVITGIEEYRKIRFFLNWKGLPVGCVDIDNYYAALSKRRFVQTIVQELNTNLFYCFSNYNKELQHAELLSALQKKFVPEIETHLPFLSSDISASIVVATYDRPNDLHKCLTSLICQKVIRQLEIIVVDNNPSSGLTYPVVKQFPNIILVNEKKKGLSYARNSGISASTGQIILSTDDDVTVPQDWVERLLAPFARPDVMVVTGNVLPIHLESTAQQLFELYGGLGRGYKRKEVNKEWFTKYKRTSAPTWDLGACANAAFRSNIFSHPHIGLMNEKLGAGSPTGCSEDTYLFYKVLKQSYTIIYEPKAYVWHNHRTTLKSLYGQVYNYSKGHVAYHLLTWWEDNDWRGLKRVFWDMPKIQIKGLYNSLTGRSAFPSSFVIKQITGSLAGPYALFRSWRRVKKLGRSEPYVLPSKRNQHPIAVIKTCAARSLPTQQKT